MRRRLSIIGGVELGQCGADAKGEKGEKDQKSSRSCSVTEGYSDRDTMVWRDHFDIPTAEKIHAPVES